MPKTNRYKMKHRKRTLKQMNSKKHNNKQRGGDNYVWYLISGFKSIKKPELIMLNKPNTVHLDKRDLFLTWYNDEIITTLNILFFNDTKFALDYHIGDGNGTVDNPYEVQLWRVAYGNYDEQIDTSKRISRYSSTQLPSKYRTAFKKPKNLKGNSKTSKNDNEFRSP
jgi:hypothetical protein